MVRKLTLEEKASLLSGNGMWKTNGLEEKGVMSLNLSDGPHGIRKQAGSGDHLGLNKSLAATCFPTAATIAQSWDEQLCRKIGNALGDEALQLDVQILLGPGLNIKRSPLCGRNFEYFSEDPYLSGKLAAGYIKGVQEKGIIACPKHFAANNQEYMRMANDSILDERTLREIYLTGFEIALEEGKPLAIMSAYNKINGLYANENGMLLSQVLRKEWGYRGIVVSDWGGGNDFVEGVRYGCNLEMPGTGGDSAKQLVEAVKRGRISEEQVDLRVKELIEVSNLFTNRDKVVGEKTDITEETRHASHRLAREAAEQSAVLLKNENQLLPLTRHQKVALVGEFAELPRYQGAGSSLVYTEVIETLQESIAVSDLDYIGYEPGYHRDSDKNTKLIEKAVSLAQQADTVIVCIGLEENLESEGVDRLHLKIHAKQTELLQRISRVNEKIIVVLSGGGVVEAEWLNKCRALLYVGLGGQASGSATYRLLRGIVNPSGKLTETYPLQWSDTAVSNYWHDAQKTSEYREGIYVGYRYFTTVNKEVRFPFGYGLSYTYFNYSNMEIDSDGVSFSIRNAGDVAGHEIAQLYVSKETSSMYRPVKELKGFTKVYLNPGETKKIRINFDNWTFRVFSSSLKQWVVESGNYRIRIGKNVEDIQLEGLMHMKNYSHEEGELKDQSGILPHYYTGHVENIQDEEFEELIGRKPPKGLWNKKALLERNDTLAQMVYAKSFPARCIEYVMRKLLERSLKKGRPNLNLVFMHSMTFRGIGKMTNGTITQEMVDGMLTMVNGKFIKGVREIYIGYKKSRHKSF